MSTNTKSCVNCLSLYKTIILFVTVPFLSHLISCRTYIPILHLSVSFTSSFIAPVLGNVRTFQVPFHILLNLFYCLG